MNPEPAAPRVRTDRSPTLSQFASQTASQSTSRSASQAGRGAKLLALSLAATASLVALPSAIAFAQDRPGDPSQPPKPDQPGVEKKDGVITINPSGPGWSVLELFSWIHKATGRSILYDETSNQKIKTAKVQFVGSHVIRESELFDWLQAVLSFNNLVLVPVGPTSPDGSQQWFCLDQNNPMIKAKPVYVSENDILELADRDGLYVVTTFTLKHISDTARVRQALTGLSTQTASIGRIQDVPGSRAVIIGDFAPVVAAMKHLVDQIDVDNFRIEPRMEVVELQHAVASELGPVLQDLIESGDQAQRRPQQPGQADEEPAPKIIPDDRLDALIIYATERYMQKIKTLIDQLDVPTRARGRLHFRALKHTDAGDMASLLSDLIDGTERSSSTGRSTSTTRRTTRPQTPTANTGGGAGGAFGGAGAEGRPVIIPDGKSNSLIIQSSPTQFESIDELITKLDTSRPQVLIETALVELALSDGLNLGVELFGSQSGIAVDTDGNGTPDAITNDRKSFGGTSYGLSDLVTTDVNGVKVPINRSPLFGTGFTAGLFKNGKLPIILTALQTSSRSKILTRPSVVANDNEEASIVLSKETAYRENVTSQNGQSQDSFKTVTADSELKISPHISSEAFLRLEIEQKVANFSKSSSGIVGAPPDKTERTIKTNVTIPDQWTVVLGGLIQEQQSSVVSKVPILGDLPVIGFLFRQTEDSSSPSQLFLFVTPRILRDMNGFREFHQATWERKLLNDDLFGKDVKLDGTNFRGPDVPPPTPTEQLDALERSGALDGARLKAPPTADDRARAAEDEYRRKQPPPVKSAVMPPVPPTVPPSDGSGTGEK